MIVRRSWLFASALLIATACGDDNPDQPAAPADGGHDAATSDAATSDAAVLADGSIDAGAGNMDASLLDATTPLDAAADATGSDAGPTTDATSGDAGPALEIIGIWHSNYGEEIEITATKFGSEAIVELDTASRTAITQNPPDDPYSPNTFNKQAWTAVTNGSFYQCTQDYGKNTAAEAEATTMKLDPSDPSKGGCGDGDFAWTQYGPVLEIRGDWQSNGSDFAITSDSFGTYKVESYDNAGDTAVLSTGGADAGPKTYGKLVWTVVTAARVDYCIVATGLASAAEAAASTATADVNMLTTGCNGGAWTSLTK